MNTIENTSFVDETVILDGNSYLRCSFDRCTLVYRGGELPYLQRNILTSCNLALEDHPKTTAIFLRSLVEFGLGDLVKQAFDQLDPLFSRALPDPQRPATSGDPISASQSFMRDLREPRWPPALPWLPRSRDPRPKCVLVVGDGFSSGFLKAHDVLDFVPSSLRHHFSQHPQLQYSPCSGDMFPRSTLWTPEKWPTLYGEWERLGRPEPWDFYRCIQKSEPKVNQTLTSNTWSIDTSSLAYQLRCYLFHHFKACFEAYYKRISADSTLFRPDRWGWNNGLLVLTSEFVLTAVSFNYDEILENALVALPTTFSMRMTPLSVLHPSGFGAPAPAQLPASSIAMLKPHGSIGLETWVDLEGHGSGANPWLSKYKRENAVLSVAPRIATAHGFGVDGLHTFPFIPNLIPPGHDLDSRFAPEIHESRIAKDELSNADVVIFCGLSANEPDTIEVRDLVSSIRNDACIIRVGLVSDKSSAIIKILDDRFGSSVQFVDAEALNNSVEPLVAALGRCDGLKLQCDWTSVLKETIEIYARRSGLAVPILLKDTHVGRAGPCLCGSGKAYYQCHGQVGDPDGAQKWASVLRPV